MIKIFGLIITTVKQYEDKLEKSYLDGIADCTSIEQRTTWSAINPVIHDLEKLRANTWDQDKITHMQERLRDNFEVK